MNNVIRDEWRLSHGDDYFNETIGIYIIHHDGEGNRRIAKPLTIDLHEEPLSKMEGRIIDPTIRIDTDTAQSVFQQLWDKGYRPNNGESSMAHVASLKYHLEDMRKLVFGKYGETVDE